jgi:hypothetical protein
MSARLRMGRSTGSGMQSSPIFLCCAIGGG